MPNDILVYGATGYSGGLVVRALRELAVRPVLCGRDEARVQEAASTFSRPHRVAGLEEASAIADVLDGVSVVLNAAGPFSHTAGAIVQACLERREIGRAHV